MTSMGSTFLSQLNASSLHDTVAGKDRRLSIAQISHGKNYDDEDDDEDDLDEGDEETGEDNVLERSMGTHSNTGFREKASAIFVDTRSSASRQFPRDYVLEMPLSPEEERGKVLQSPVHNA